MARYGEASQLDITEAAGAPQVSKPAPWYSDCTGFAAGSASGRASAGADGRPAPFQARPSGAWPGARPGPATLMLAWIWRASAGCRPQDTLTSTAGPGRITVTVCVAAGSGFTRADCPPARTARVASRESGLAGSATVSHADSVLPTRPGGQCGAG